MLSARPMQPIIRTIIGSWTSVTLMDRSMDCKKIESASARRKTPLKKAPGNR